MIRVLIGILLALALGASAAYYVRADAGYVLLAYGDWSLETSLLGAALGLIVVLLVLRYGLRWLLATLRLPTTLKRSVSNRRERRARESFETGLRYWLDGRWQKAEVELVRRAADHPANSLNYLLAAQAARQLEAPQRSERYLQQASDTQSSGANLMRAELAMQNRDWDAARAQLTALIAQNPEHDSAIERLAEVQAAQGDWDALRALLTASATQRALTPERQQHWQLKLARGLLQAPLEAARLDQFKQLWESFAAALRADAGLQLFYLRGLLRLNAEAEAAAQISTALRDHWQPELVQLYGQAQGLDALGVLASAENWLGQYGEKPELLLLAARACVRNKLWGKARSYLDGLVRINPTPAAYLELARLSEQTQNAEDASRFYRLGLEAATT